MFFEDTDVHSGASQQVTQHNAGGPSASDATPCRLRHVLTRANSLMALAAWMATVAKDIGRLGLTFTVGAAIVTVGFSVAMATGMRTLLWLIHGLHAPDSKIKLSALRFEIVYTSGGIALDPERLKRLTGGPALDSRVIDCRTEWARKTSTAREPSGTSTQHSPRR